MPVNNMDGNNCSEKICIQGKKVFDACVKQTTLQQITVNVTDVNPANPATPLRFVSAKSTTTKGVIENLVVERLTERPKYGRVQADVVVPVEVVYIDSNNEEGSGLGTVTVPIDVVMFLPEPSIIPYTIEASVSAVSPEGQYSQTQEIDGVTYYIFVINCCVTAILKVTMDVELIIPSYGYAVIPPCQDYSEEVCSGYFELPLYPGGRNTGGGNT
ncbi:MAG: hypothetical protein J1G02_04165 [Clostridiales bacterium]|nr:hypothetical protein [Clostridiales bacterium]